MSHMWFSFCVHISSIWKPWGLFPREVKESGVDDSLEHYFHSSLSLLKQISCQNNLFYCIIYPHYPPLMRTNFQNISACQWEAIWNQSVVVAWIVPAKGSSNFKFYATSAQPLTPLIEIQLYFGISISSLGLLLPFISSGFPKKTRQWQSKWQEHVL